MNPGVLDRLKTSLHAVDVSDAPAAKRKHMSRNSVEQEASWVFLLNVDTSSQPETTPFTLGWELRAEAGPRRGFLFPAGLFSAVCLRRKKVFWIICFAIIWKILTNRVQNLEMREAGKFLIMR